MRSGIKYYVLGIMGILFFSLPLILNTNPLILTQAASPQPEATSCGTSHENGICMVNILAPEEIEEDVKVEKKNFLDEILAKINELAGKLGFRPAYPSNYYPRSDFQSNSETPEEVHPSAPPEESLPGFLGDEGVWGVTLPEFDGEGQTPPEKSEDWEKEYEDSYFPENIDRITNP